MPGFGWLIGDGGSFAYACDALLGVSPLEERAPMAYRADGALLVGTAHGVRRLDASGCPSSAVALAEAPIVALAVHPVDAQRVIAVGQAEGAAARVHVSDDGGESFRAGAELGLAPVTALVLDASDSRSLYLSRTASVTVTSIDVSDDGGASFRTIEAPRALTLLHADARARRFWALARVANAAVGAVILRADEIEGPWREVLNVNFFGGLAVDPDDPDRIFIGDEARGVFRSTDGGATFEEVSPEINSAALGYAEGALWSCTPGSAHATALVRSEEQGAAFQPMMAFTDVEALVACAGADVEGTCRAAWIEWQRDVLEAPRPSSQMTAPDASTSDAAAHDAALAPEVTAATPHGEHGCSAARSPGSGSAACSLMLAVIWLTRRRRAVAP